MFSRAFINNEDYYTHYPPTMSKQQLNTTILYPIPEERRIKTDCQIILPLSLRRVSNITGGQSKISLQWHHLAPEKMSCYKAKGELQCALSQQNWDCNTATKILAILSCSVWLPCLFPLQEQKLNGTTGLGIFVLAMGWSFEKRGRLTNRRRFYISQLGSLKKKKTEFPITQIYYIDFLFRKWHFHQSLTPITQLALEAAHPETATKFKSFLCFLVLMRNVKRFDPFD